MPRKPRPRPTRTCPGCARQFTPARQGTFCSERCRLADKAAGRVEGLPATFLDVVDAWAAVRGTNRVEVLTTFIGLVVLPTTLDGPAAALRRAHRIAYPDRKRQRGES